VPFERRGASGRESAESWQIVNLAATLSPGAATTSETAQHRPSSVDRGHRSYGQWHLFSLRTGRPGSCFGSTQTQSSSQRLSAAAATIRKS
jgi:hypothetical protein